MGELSLFLVFASTNMTPDDHVAAFVRDGHTRQGENAEDTMMMMLRRLRNEMTCVGLEEYMYPNCLLAKAMKEGKMKLVKTSSERYRTCRCCDGGGSWTYDYETPSGLPFQVYYCYTSVTGWEASDSGREAEEDVRVFFYGRKTKIMEEVKRAVCEMKHSFLGAYVRLSDARTVYDFVKWWIERPQLSVRKDILARLECCICGEEDDDECLEEKIEGMIAGVFADRDVGSSVAGVD